MTTHDFWPELPARSILRPATIPESETAPRRTTMTSPDCPYVMHGALPTTPDLVADLRRQVEEAARRQALREERHDAQLAGWREACLDYGIQPDSGSLRVYLQTMRDALRSIDRLLRIAAEGER